MDIDLVNDLRRDDDDSGDEEVEEKNDDDDENQESKNADVESVMKKASEIAKKKAARRPRPKLDVDRLTGPRGLSELCELFKTEKFKGKGHEFADLDTLMHKFEYWSHRLVPHMIFDDFIEKAEKLGSKKAVKNAVQRLRDELNAKNGTDDNDDDGQTLIDLLPTMGVEPEEDFSSKQNVDNDIPDDDELNELFQ